MAAKTETKHAPYAKTAQIITTIREEDRERLDAAVTVAQVSRAEMIRRFVIAGLDRIDGEA